jgi:hypothetical protein
MGRMTAGRDFVSEADQGTAPGAPVPARPPQASRHRWLAAAGWVLGVVLAFAVYLRLARTRAVDSDGASQALQAWDMLHGNVLLRGWRLSDVSFFTTELPQYMLVELVRGLNSGVVHVAAAITYTLVVLLAALLAKGRATGRAAVARVLIAVGIMLAPQLTLGVKTLISSPDHIGTSVPVLVVWLILDRARPRWYVPVIAAVLLGWATVADTLVLYIGVLPLALVCAIRVWRAVAVEGRPLVSQWYDFGLGAGALAGGVAGGLALHVIRAVGGFLVQPPMTQFVHGAVLPHSLGVTAEGLLLLGGADFLGLRLGATAAVLILHLVGVVLAGWGTWLAARRFLKDANLVDQVLVTAVAIDLAAYVLSTESGSVLETREIAAVLPFSAVLAGRLLADRVLAAKLGPVLLVVLLGYLGGLAYEIVQPPVPAQNQQLASWLAARHLHTGLSGYWQSNVVTLTSGNRVQIRQLSSSNGRLIPDAWESKAAWYDPRRSSANFVVLVPGTNEYPGFTDKRAVLATFGRPARSYRVGSYQVLVWNRNLLADLGARMIPVAAASGAG